MRKPVLFPARTLIAAGQAVLLLLNDGPGNAQAQGRTWTVSELHEAISRHPEYLAGKFEGSQCEILGRVVSAVLDDRGYTYALDVIARSISVFDTAGRCLQRIGRAGGGPGEFRAPQRLLMVGAHLLILDPGNARVERYDVSSLPLRRLSPLRVTIFTRDFCGSEDDLWFAAAHEDAVAHRLNAEGVPVQSVGELYDGSDRVMFSIAEPGEVLCGAAQETVVVAGHRVPDVRRFQTRGGMVWKARIPDFAEAELIMSGPRIRGFKPSDRGLNYVAALLQISPHSALVQAGTPTDVGIRRNSSLLT